MWPGAAVPDGVLRLLPQYLYQRLRGSAQPQRQQLDRFLVAVLSVAPSDNRVLPGGRCAPKAGAAAPRHAVEGGHRGGGPSRGRW